MDSDSPQDEKIPPIPKQLLEYLDRLYPDSCPDLSLADREVWYKAGQRSVIGFLFRVYSEQTERLVP